ncbi:MULTISPECIES: hypothetical protein [unclassified Janthinobacterium]|uniref:hypothetical protein n=1 Tax=unclassified Janthinobacterium TaxID=2610881 RepID=UPI0018CA3280|nr:hypothetical protein [Janthinobacterium sp. CG_23.4]MDH6158549.1 hypothetical protein [Janthinobacterium sp. CG_23.4]
MKAALKAYPAKRNVAVTPAPAGARAPAAYANIEGLLQGMTAEKQDGVAKFIIDDKGTWQPQPAMPDARKATIRRRKSWPLLLWLEWQGGAL